MKVLLKFVALLPIFTAARKGYAECPFEHSERIFPDVNLKVIGGARVPNKQFPWQVSLRPTVYCGGTLISTNTVISAVHCLNSYVEQVFQRREFYIKTGQINPGPNDPGYQKRLVSEIIKHPDYDPTRGAKLDNDIMILKVDYQFDITDYVKPAYLPRRSKKLKETETLFISGWGTTKLGKAGVGSPVLMYAEVKMNSFKSCKQSFGSNLTSGMVCASSPGVNTCRGDSGGPLMACKKGRAVLVGVTSFGKQGCWGAAVYTKVTHYLDFINAAILI